MTFSVYVIDPRMIVTAAKVGSSVELELTDPAGLIAEDEKDVPGLLDALRGTAEWLTGVSLWFGALDGEITDADRAMSASVAKSLAGAIGSAGATLRATFPDYAVHNYAVASAEQAANEITLTLSVPKV